jgi:hypothetical protein
MTTSGSTARCAENGHYHVLDCTHIITTRLHPSELGPSACAPNCSREIYIEKPQLSRIWFKSTSRLPFICPVCVEECVRTDYDRLQKKHTKRMGKVVDDHRSNVEAWLYKAVVELVREGGRLCQAMDGKCMFNMEICEELARSGSVDTSEALEGGGLSTDKGDVEILVGRLEDVKISVRESDENLAVVMEKLGL